MDYEEFQRQSEAHAQEEFDTFLSQSVADLLDAAREGRHGSYHQLWRAIADRASLEEAAPVLLEVLRAERLYWPKERPWHNTYAIRINRRQAEYLARYHCAEALLRMLDLDESLEAAVNLAADRPTRIQNVERIARHVEQRLRNR